MIIPGGLVLHWIDWMQHPIADDTKYILSAQNIMPRNQWGAEGCEVLLAEVQSWAVHIFPCIWSVNHT